jgi:hypothetical protein
MTAWRTPVLAIRTAACPGVLLRLSPAPVRDVRELQKPVSTITTSGHATGGTSRRRQNSASCLPASLKPKRILRDNTTNARSKPGNSGQGTNDEPHDAVMHHNNRQAAPPARLCAPFALPFQLVLMIADRLASMVVDHLHLPRRPLVPAAERTNRWPQSSPARGRDAPDGAPRTVLAGLVEAFGSFREAPHRRNHLRRPTRRVGSGRRNPATKSLSQLINQGQPDAPL